MPVNDASNSSKGISGGAIAGIVVGVVAGVLLGLLAFFLCKRRRRGHGQGMYDTPDPYNIVPSRTPYVGGKGPETPGMSPVVPAPVSYETTSYFSQEPRE